MTQAVKTHKEATIKYTLKAKKSYIKGFYGIWVFKKRN